MVLKILKETFLLRRRRKKSFGSEYSAVAPEAASPSNGVALDQRLQAVQREEADGRPGNAALKAVVEQAVELRLHAENSHR